MREYPHRLEHCSECGIAAAGDGPRCIFCGAGLMLEPVKQWRALYHPYSYADALLATAALKANGVTARLQQWDAERMLLGRGGVVQVAADEHMVAREVLRKLRGVRTDTEYLEWQALRAKPMRLGLLIGALAAGAVIAAGIIFHLLSEAAPAQPVQRQSAR
jgi:hypothetical protein